MKQQPNEKVGAEARIEEMARYGISRVPVDNFYYREFHYTNLEDAVAQAMRDEIQLRRSPTA